MLKLRALAFFTILGDTGTFGRHGLPEKASLWACL